MKKTGEIGINPEHPPINRPIQKTIYYGEESSCDKVAPSEINTPNPVHRKFFEKKAPTNNLGRRNYLEKATLDNPNRREFFKNAGLAFLSIATAVTLHEVSQKTKAFTAAKKSLDYSPSNNKNNSEKENIASTSKTLEPIQETKVDSPPQEDISHPESIDMESLALEIQTSTRKLLEDDNFFPKKLFSKNLLIAIQIQESNLKKDAVSTMGALGVMQVMPITIAEVVRYIGILKKDKKINFKTPLNENLSSKDIESLSTIIKDNPSLGKVFGKLYLADLFNNHDIGKDIYNLGGITKARKKLLVAYNWNPTSFKRNETDESAWPAESRQYYKNIFNFMETLKKVQKKFIAKKIKTNPDELSALLVAELRKYEGEIELNHSLLENSINKYVQGIKDAENKLKRELTEDEIIETLDKLNYEAYKALLISKKNNPTLAKN